MTMLRKRAGLFLILSTLIITATTSVYAAYNSSAPLYVKKVEFCIDKPKGLGIFELRESNEYKKGENEVYIYLEVANCKQKRGTSDYYTSLSVDVDIYYEDGMLVFSEDEVNMHDARSVKRDSNGYLWVMINARYLKEGEYKIEMTIRDQHTKKEAFAVTRFKKIWSS